MKYERVTLDLEIEVKTIEYDRVSLMLRFGGKNFSENEYTYRLAHITPSHLS
ncbi:hypothetical protein M758_4G196800 [Ceratodon purpureus]|nr:hypothetical protein M758_4G196800 [Ceratodon purpureus]